MFSYLGGAVACLLPLSIILTGTGRGEPAPAATWPFFAAVIALVPVSWGLSIGLRRAKRRELLAGYTTLPRGDISRPYVDSISGVVYREAGDPQLTRAELTGIARERKLARAKAKNPLAF